MAEDVKKAHAGVDEVKKNIGSDVDYVAAITKLKADKEQNYVPKVELEAALAEKKKLLDALVNGKQLEVDNKDELTKLREQMKKGCSNLDYVKASLKLREDSIKKGHPDPYESASSDKQIVDGNRVASALQDLVDRSSSPEVFNALLDNAMVNDKVGGLGRR